MCRSSVAIQYALKFKILAEALAHLPKGGPRRRRKKMDSTPIATTQQIR